jgi:hypothetical protein
LNGILNYEVGIQNAFKMNIEIFQNKFHLNDCILGRIIFNKVKFSIKSIEAHLYKKEIIWSINKIYINI